MKFYDKKNRRLIVIERKATPRFWDQHWAVGEIRKKIKAGINNRLIKKYTFKFLKPGTKILEGGCGLGQNVYGLSQWGYDSYGVDFAENTIKKIKKEFPELKISVQDVKKINFPTNFFDGYWSLGVIEHFWDGYDKILQEAQRVIKPNGYLFLTFPYMSPLRRLKAKLNFYKIFQNYSDNNFYEFIFDNNQVKKRVEKYGFSFCLKYPFDATKGLKDEIFLLKPFLQKVYNSRNIIAKGVKLLCAILFSKIASHMVLLVFRKDEK